MRLTHNSLATIIGWVSTSLLAGGASTLFSESVRTMWMSWGCFGIAAALGLDITARARERKRLDEMKVIANRRFERDMKYETDDKDANVAIRRAVARMLGRTLREPQTTTSRRTQERYRCDLRVELPLAHSSKGVADNKNTNASLARVTNLSDSGFEMLLTEPLPNRRMEMIITAANGEKQAMFGEVLWSDRQEDGSIVAGGRFLDAAFVDGD